MEPEDWEEPHYCDAMDCRVQPGCPLYFVPDTRSYEERYGMTQEEYLAPFGPAWQEERRMTR